MRRAGQQNAVVPPQRNGPARLGPFRLEGLDHSAQIDRGVDHRETVIRARHARGHGQAPLPGDAAFDRNAHVAPAGRRPHGRLEIFAIGHVVERRARSVGETEEIAARRHQTDFDQSTGPLPELLDQGPESVIGARIDGIVPLQPVLGAHLEDFGHLDHVAYVLLDRVGHLQQSAFGHGNGVLAAGIRPIAETAPQTGQKYRHQRGHVTDGPPVLSPRRHAFTHSVPVTEPVDSRNGACVASAPARSAVVLRKAVFTLTSWTAAAFHAAHGGGKSRQKKSRTGVVRDINPIVAMGQGGSNIVSGGR